MKELVINSDGRLTNDEIELAKTWFDARLTNEDRQWIGEHFELAQVSIPPVDISWIGFTTD